MVDPLRRRFTQSESRQRYGEGAGGTTGGDSGGGTTSGIVMSPPSAGDFPATFNFHSTTKFFNDRTGALILMQENDASNFGSQIAAKSYPGPPYTIIAKLDSHNPETSFPFCGICVYDNNNQKHLVAGFQSRDNWKHAYVVSMNSPTSINADEYQVEQADFGPWWVKVNDDGTNLNFGWSKTPDNIPTRFSAGRLNFLSAITHVGFCVRTQGSGQTPIFLRIEDFEEF